MIGDPNASYDSIIMRRLVGFSQKALHGGAQRILKIRRYTNGGTTIHTGQHRLYLLLELYLPSAQNLIRL